MTDTLTREHEPIRRYCFPACRQENHSACPGWQPGYIDGLLRGAGEQCSCACHKKG